MISHIIEAIIACFILDGIFYYMIPNAYKHILNKARNMM
jgi:uncharacterized protein YjeT (DUF2065 family)